MLLYQRKQQQQQPVSRSANNNTAGNGAGTPVPTGEPLRYNCKTLLTSPMDSGNSSSDETVVSSSDGIMPPGSHMSNISQLSNLIK